MRRVTLWGMPKRSRIASKRPAPDDPTDPILTAARIFRQATGEEPKSGPPEVPVAREKNPAAVALGKLGGVKGGKARSAKLSARRRKEIARKAAKARWKSRAVAAYVNENSKAGPLHSST